jgi:hypothetical protein
MPTRREQIRNASNRHDLVALIQLAAFLVIMLPVLLAGGSDRCQFAPYRDDAQSAQQKAIFSSGEAREIKPMDSGAQISGEISLEKPNLKYKGSVPLILQA